MNDDISGAMKYLSVPAGSFWKWADGGKVIVWNHCDSTIVFREELAVLLSRLMHRGLPSLDAVLLVLASLKPSWKDENERLWKKASESAAVHDGRITHSDPALATFSKLGNLRLELKGRGKSVHEKSDLLAMIFDSTPTVGPPSMAKVVCALLQDGLLPETSTIVSLSRLRGGRVQTRKSLGEDLRLIGFNLPDDVAESLRLRAQTGLDELPLPASIELPEATFVEADDVRELVFRSMNDEALYGVARIARALSAVVSWPRSIEDSNEMPLGGVSDLTNRGSLDRLLLSELAHDDLMLATRVALNEALYLRRESPPSHPPQCRFILIDTGLRMWGVPRVFSTAVALSLASSGGRGTTSSLHRAARDEIIPIDIASSQGLVDLLAALEPTAHPGDALGAFRRHIEQSSVAGEVAGEVVLITTPSVLTDADFQQCWIESSPATQAYLATVERSGDFQLWLQSARTRKLVASVRLDLDELLKPTTKATVVPSARLIDKSIDERLPAIFRETPFPLRLSYDARHETLNHSIWSVPYCDDATARETAAQPMRNPDQVGSTVATTRTSEVSPQKSEACGVMVLTRDRRLMLHDDPHRGARQIAEGIPFGRCIWSQTDRELRQNEALIHREVDPSLTLIVTDLVTYGISETHKLASETLAKSGAGSKIVGVASSRQNLFVIFSNLIEVFLRTDGSLIHSEYYDPAHLKWNRSRFFEDRLDASHDRMRLMSFDGTSLRFDTIRQFGPHKTGMILAMFERRGVDGPFGVHLRGSIARLSDETEWAWTTDARSNPKVIDIAEDGRRLLIEQNSDIKGKSGRIMKVIEFKDQSVEGCVTESRYSHTSSLADLDLRGMSVGQTLPHRFTRITADPDGTLILISKRGVAWKIELGTKSHSRGSLVMRSDQLFQGSTFMVSFEPARHSNPGCTLGVATWPEGSRAFIDSRGLLHLQSSDNSTPEVTLVLNEHVISGWTSNNYWFGHVKYYSVPTVAPTLTAFEIQMTILKPFAERIVAIR